MSVDPQSLEAVTPLKVWRPVFSAFCTSFIALGLARFAYTPLLPAIIEAHWFEPSAAAYLGAANLLGYLAGAFVARPISERITVATTLQVMMLFIIMTFFASAYPVSFAWFFFWRFTAGFAGGGLMVLGPTAALTHIPSARRGVAGGAVFMGAGVGIVASGTLVPLLLQYGVTQTWLTLGVIATVLMFLAWGGWPDEERPRPSTYLSTVPTLAPSTTSVPLRALYVEYSLNSVGWLPHMLFLVDFVARGLHQGVATGAEYWILFGIGATVGPIASGMLADRIGFTAGLRLAFLIVACAVVLPTVSTSRLCLIASSLGVGSFTTGTVPLILGRINDILPKQQSRQKAAWSTATVIFATCQAGVAYFLSFLFEKSHGNYQFLFALGAGAMVLALIIDFLVPSHPANGRS